MVHVEMTKSPEHDFFDVLPFLMDRLEIMLQDYHSYLPEKVHRTSLEANNIIDKFLGPMATRFERYLHFDLQDPPPKVSVCGLAHLIPRDPIELDKSNLMKLHQLGKYLSWTINLDQVHTFYSDDERVKYEVNSRNKAYSFLDATTIPLPLLELLPRNYRLLAPPGLLHVGYSHQIEADNLLLIIITAVDGNQKYLQRTFDLTEEFDDEFLIEELEVLRRKNKAVAAISSRAFYHHHFGRFEPPRTHLNLH